MTAAMNDQILLFDNDPAGNTLRTSTTILKNPNQQSSIRYHDSVSFRFLSHAC
jgi:hypothetical protein